jgi:hypothetical protein
VLVGFSPTNLKSLVHVNVIHLALYTWILADVIMAPTITSSGSLARVGMLGALPLTAKP